MNEEQTIEDFLEGVTADDFDRTSARDDAPYGEPISGEDDFNHFVEYYLDATRIAYEASDGYMNPWAILHRPDRRRLFVPDDDETVKMYCDRLQREAKAFEATWCYIAMVGPGGAAGKDQHLPTGQQMYDEDPSTSEFEPAFAASICWYAEADEDDFQMARFGIIELRNGRLSRIVENDDPEHEGASPLFTQILR